MADLFTSIPLANLERVESVRRFMGFTPLMDALVTAARAIIWERGEADIAVVDFKDILVSLFASIPLVNLERVESVTLDLDINAIMDALVTAARAIIWERGEADKIQLGSIRTMGSLFRSITLPIEKGETSIGLVGFTL